MQMNGQSCKHTSPLADTPLALNESVIEINRDRPHYHTRNGMAALPHKLSGEDIPLSARIVAIADVFDALTSEFVQRSLAN